MVHLLFQLSSSTAIVPTVEGLEYTLAANKLHYVIDDNLTHFTMPTDRVHYDFEDEDK